MSTVTRENAENVGKADEYAETEEAQSILDSKSFISVEEAASALERNGDVEVFEAESIERKISYESRSVDAEFAVVPEYASDGYEGEVMTRTGSGRDRPIRAYDDEGEAYVLMNL